MIRMSKGLKDLLDSVDLNNEISPNSHLYLSLRDYNIYIAGSSENRIQISCLASVILTTLNIKLKAEILNFKIAPNLVGMWYTDPVIDCLPERANFDISELDKANVLVVTYPYGYGTCAEMGYAAGKKIPIIYIRDPYFMDEDPLIAGLLDVYEPEKFIESDLGFSYAGTLPKTGFIVANIEELIGVLCLYYNKM